MNVKIDSEFNALIPPIESAELSQLEANIKVDGCRDPLVTWNGLLLDGHNRKAICERLGIEFKTVAMEFADRDHAALWIRFNQLGRRNLSDDQRAMIADEAAEQESRLAVSEKLAKARAVKAGSMATTASAIEKPKDRTPRSTEKAAKAAKVSERKMKKARKVRKASPSIAKKVRAGELTLSQANRQIRRSEQENKLAEAQAKPKVVSIKGPYDLIVADPPWKYDFEEAGNREIENQYPTATVEEICTHAPISSKNAILFLWATAPKLEEALKVMAAWGFSYRTCAIWDKQKIGMGYWFRVQHELLLVGVKGKPGATPESERRASIFSEPRGKHSVKPEAVYDWIDRAFPEAKKLEMYLRGKTRIGWAGHGNECE